MRSDAGGSGGSGGNGGSCGRGQVEALAAGVTRRGLLQSIGVLAGIAAGSAALPGLAAQTATQAADSAARRRAAAGRLADPTVAGRPRQPTSSADNDVAIQELEKRLRCGCGCTLDVYTCRTTDFTCTYSPELHREVLALQEAGKSPDEIVDAFVAKYGEEALMAPEPEGFNLAGYLVPGVVVTGLGATLLWVLSRRGRLAGAAGAAGTAAGAGAPSAASAVPAHPAAPALTDDDLALVQKALAEDEQR